MSQSLIKSILPRGLYGRALLILILPVVVIQLVVSVMFLQRHFEDVTRQMTLSTLREIGFVLAQIGPPPPALLPEDAPQPPAHPLPADRSAARRAAEAVARPLGIRVELPAPALPQDRRVFYDLSGRVLTGLMRDHLPGLSGVDLSAPREVRLGLETAYGPMALSFDRRRVSASNPHQLLVLMGLTSLLMTLIAMIFLRNQLRPIRRLSRAAEAFGRGQSIPYRPAGASEVRAAGAAFLGMRTRIERHIESRTMMLSGISHDLRTPLTRLRLGLSMLPSGQAPDPGDIAEMERDVAEMGRLVDAFLDFARGDAEDERRARVDLGVYLARITQGHARGGADVTLSPPPEGSCVSLRPHAVERALDNLIGNALRYGGMARVSAQIGAKSLVLVVEDAGPGIPAERRAEALRPFTRLDDARNQDRGPGVGLGLAIASDLARGHGGVLRLGDSAEWGGLKAEIVLPL